MSRRAFPWSRLGIDPTKDTGAIRKAYADILRATNLDDDIAGYAELRRARDHALWLAAQPDVEEESAGEEDEGEVYGLGSLDDDDDDDDIGLGDWDDADYPWDDSPSAQHPDPVSGDDPAPELTEAQLRAQAAWNTMLDVLYPDGEPSEEAVTHEQLETGLAALGVLIARAEEADLLEHDALDNALGELFARTWPRSAPFVEPANEAFHWLGEAGALEERYALRFLNDRLKGMRFHEKVQQPGHPLHKAWAELSRPGRAGFVDRLRVRRLDIHRLLTGIRERYPELESLLDAERVRSWENGGGVAEGASNAGRGFGGALLFVVLFFALMRGVAALMGPTGDDDAGKPPLAEVEAALKTAELDIAADRVFGKGFKFADVRAADPNFAKTFEALVSIADKAPIEPIDYARTQAIGASQVAANNELVVRADLKSLWLNAARRLPGDACQKLMRGDLRKLDLKLTDKEQSREQALLRQLLEAKVLSNKAEGGETRYTIPGWLIEAMLKRSGLSEERLVAALRNPDSPDRCGVEFALVEAVRAAPGKVPKEVLKGL
ncbi:hypothetical protein [Erythrobacter colymbi]|uniref:hypothetical protein n=1 Tax=Erythrobacter colymbi TaxID=1161202 RepID=UPI000A391035|nr:hypothetical protein [Erythrobacter colymbi]